MAPLGELIAALLPGARVAWPPDGLPDVEDGRAGAGRGPVVGWVRVMKARVPAFDALDAGDLAIVPVSVLAVVATEPAQAAAIADLCRASRVAAIVLVEGEDAGADPDTARAADALEQAVARAGGPILVRAARADAGALERAVIGFLVNRRAELDRQAAVLETRIEAIALEGGGAAAMVGEVGAFLGRAVALEDGRGEPLAVHAPPTVADAAAAVAAYHGRRGAGRGRSGPRPAALRVPLPTPGGPAGNLALLGDRAPGELEQVVAARIAGLLALELARDDAVRRARDTARAAESLPSAGPPWAVLVARQRRPGPRVSGPSPVPGRVGDLPEPVERREAIRRDLRQLAPARRMSLRGDADSLELRLVLAGDAADADATELAGRIAAFLERTVAVSRPFDVPGGRPAAEADARATLEAAEALAEPPRVALAALLGAYRLLGGLHHLPDGQRHAAALLEPILAGRPDVRREHLATLRAVLGHAGINEAAAALGVHRNTVAYRLRRIEALTGWRLDDPDLRVALGVAVRLVQTD